MLLGLVRKLLLNYSFLMNQAKSNPSQYSRLPVVAIVGEPNVGKSSLFNRLVGRGQAVVHDTAGTTRDRVSAELTFDRLSLELVDTAGLTDSKGEDLEDDIRAQVELAIFQADFLVFVVDIKKDINAAGLAAAKIIRQSGKPYALIANKCDNFDEQAKIKFFEYGLGEPITTSVVHKFGLNELIKVIEKKLRDIGFRKKLIKPADIKISILGRPNVGKSSLINAFLGEKRVIVSKESGTTRDSIDVSFFYNNKKYIFIDTAGLRRRGKIKPGVEWYSARRADLAIRRSDISFLVLDGADQIARGDLRVAEKICEAKKGFIIVVNKIDLFESEEDRFSFEQFLRSRFEFAPFAPVVFVSAFNQKNLTRLLDLANDIFTEQGKRISTAKLNAFVARIVAKHLPKGTKRIPPKILYATQVDTHPPHFIFFVNKEDSFHFSWRRYLENEMRKAFGFVGINFKIEFKERKNEDFMKNMGIYRKFN